jgi:hypothetical protein
MKTGAHCDLCMGEPNNGAVKWCGGGVVVTEEMSVCGTRRCQALQFPHNATHSDGKHHIGSIRFNYITAPFGSIARRASELERLFLFLCSVREAQKALPSRRQAKSHARSSSYAKGSPNHTRLPIAYLCFN